MSTTPSPGADAENPRKRFVFDEDTIDDLKIRGPEASPEKPLYVPVPSIALRADTASDSPVAVAQVPPAGPDASAFKRLCSAAFYKIPITDQSVSFLKGFTAAIVVAGAAKVGLESLLGVPQGALQQIAWFGLGGVAGMYVKHYVIDGPLTRNRFRDENPTYWPGVQGLMAGAAAIGLYQCVIQPLLR